MCDGFDGDCDLTNDGPDEEIIQRELADIEQRFACFFGGFELLAAWEDDSDGDRYDDMEDQHLDGMYDE